MHSYQCCGLVVGISVTGAGAVSGQLGVVLARIRRDAQQTPPGSAYLLRTPEAFVSYAIVPCLVSTVACSLRPATRKLPPRSAGVSERLDAVWEVREQAHRRVSQPPSPAATGRG
jgi:hypothetical protein